MEATKMSQNTILNASVQTDTSKKTADLITLNNPSTSSTPSTPKKSASTEVGTTSTKKSASTEVGTTSTKKSASTEVGSVGTKKSASTEVGTTSTKKVTGSIKKNTEVSASNTEVSTSSAEVSTPSAEVSTTSTEVSTTSAEVIKKKSNETDGYRKIQLMISTAKEEAIEEMQKSTKKDLYEFKDLIMGEFQEIKQLITKVLSSKSAGKSSNDNAALSDTVDLLSRMNDLSTKMNDLSTKTNDLVTNINSSNEKQEFNFNWLKLALDGVMHKDDIDVGAVVKGDVKLVKKAPTKAKAIDSSSKVDLSTVKSTNFLKHQVLHDSEYILELFKNKDNENHITNCICEHIKALPIAASFSKDADISEKVEFFTNYVRSNETASTKLFTLLNKNTVFKKYITSSFDSWKSQNTVNVNKDFLGEEDA